MTVPVISALKKISPLLEYIDEGTVEMALTIEPPEELVAKAENLGVSDKIALHAAKKLIEKEDRGDKAVGEKTPLRILPPKKEYGTLHSYLDKNYHTYLKNLTCEDAQTRKVALLDLIFYSRSEELDPESLQIMSTLFYAFNKRVEFKEISGSGIKAKENVIKKIIELEGGDSIFFPKVETAAYPAVGKDPSTAATEELSKEVSKKPIAASDEKTGELPEFRKPESYDLIFKVDMELVTKEIAHDSATNKPTRHKTELPDRMEIKVEGSCPVERQPLAGVYSQGFLDPKEVDKTETKELFSSDDMKCVDDDIKMRPSARKKLEQMNRGIEAAGKKALFNPKEGVDEAEIRKILAQTKDTAKLQASALKDNIHKIVNTKPQGKTFEKHEIRAMKQAKHQRILVMEDVLAAVLQGNGALLKKANPYLSDDQIKELFKHTIDMYLFQAQASQAEEALSEKEISKMGEVLSRKREYNPYEYPQLAIFEGTTGKMVRKDQLEAITWAIEALDKGDSAEAMRLLQAFAGFGKTKIFSVIVALIVSTHVKGSKLPVITQIGPLYDPGKEDLTSALKGAFDQFLEVIEKEVGDDIDETELEAIMNNLDLWQKEGKCLIIKPETWHVINIIYKECIISNPKKAALAKDIIDFFKKQGFVIPDEAHLILNPLQEVNKAVGDPRSIAVEERSLLLANYKLIAASKICGLKDNKQASMNEADFKSLQEELVDGTVNNKDFWGDVDKKEMKAFLMDPNGIRTDWFSKLEVSQQNLIALQHGFIHSLLPHLMAMRGGIDYGDSPKTGDLSASPRIDGQPTESKFSDEYITCALTIQHVLQKGITETEVKIILAKFKESHISEKMDLSRGRLSENYINSFLKNKINFDRIDLNNPETIKAITAELQGKQEFIDIYLRDIALPTIKVYDQKISSTPQEFLAGFYAGICLSATPGSLETLPLELRHDKNKLDPSSEALALDVMLSSRNAKVVTVPSEITLEKYFETLLEQAPGVSKKINFLIDRAGQFQKKNPQEVVSCMLSIAKELTSAIYMTDSAEGRRQVQVKRKVEGDTRSLKGSDLASGFKSAGLDIGLLKDAFYYYSLMETTGTDWKLPEEAHGALTVGEGQTVTDTIQAMRRDRQADSLKHSFEWVLSEKLLNKIPKHLKQKDGSVTPKDLLIWMICNESDKEEDKVMMRFSQGIQKIKLEALQRLADKTRFSKACLTRTKAENRDRFTKLEQKEIIEEEEKKEYLLGQALIQLPSELTEAERKSVQALVEDTAKMLGKIKSGKKEHLSAMEMQKTDQKQQQQEKVQQMAQSLQMQAQGGSKIYSEKYTSKYSLDKLPEKWDELDFHNTLDNLFSEAAYKDKGLPKMYFSKPFWEYMSPKNP